MPQLLEQVARMGRPIATAGSLMVAVVALARSLLVALVRSLMVGLACRLTAAEET